MQRKNAHRLLFAVALLTVPVPFYLGEVELAPVARLLFFSGLLARLFAAEGGGKGGLFAGLGALQALVYAGLLGLAASLVARLLVRLRRPRVRTALVVGLATAMLGLSLAPVYDTPLSSTRPRSSLLHIFE